jgi:Flp pilus assembly pilin Flp
MGKLLHRFWTNEDGQDLYEYTLLIGLMTLGVVGLLTIPAPAVTTIWTSTSTTAAHAAALAGS